jgi:exopolyphosphatase / guanosine-5'-triphosphate,3'-diphosphate pyrophosphatase
MAGGMSAPAAVLEAVSVALQNASALVPRQRPPLFAALDLGTNNCRLLIAQRTRDGFRVVDSFSRIVRLGEGLALTGKLSDAAMDRALSALEACANRLRRKDLAGVRCVATQACRAASNGAQFIERAFVETGIQLDVIAPEDEARLAVAGCADLIDPSAEGALVVDIGGGSTELSFARHRHGDVPDLLDWVSLPMGVVTLADNHPEHGDREAWYSDMVQAARAQVARFNPPRAMASAFAARRAHIVGTSGAATSLAGVHLGLQRYSRKRVDGMWLRETHARAAISRLKALTPQQRAKVPCIGPNRADLVLAGGALLQAVLERWPSERIRVADRGLREGLILSMLADHAGQPARVGAQHLA